MKDMVKLCCLLFITRDEVMWRFGQGLRGIAFGKRYLMFSPNWRAMVRHTEWLCIAYEVHDAFSLQRGQKSTTYME